MKIMANMKENGEKKKKKARIIENNSGEKPKANES
jgi:hypothetical protein